MGISVRLERTVTGFEGFQRRAARAVNSGNLAWSETGDADIDYVTARGMSGDKLGALLESLKWANDHRAYGAAVRLLSERFYKRTKRDVLKCLSHTAIREWIDQNCQVCGGRGTTMNERGVLSRCGHCGGTGLRARTDEDRARMASLAVDSWRKHKRDYEIVVACLLGSVSAHRAGTVKALG